MIVHVLHSFYGNDNAPGGRSRRIAESADRADTVLAYGLLDRPRLNPAPGVEVRRAINTLAQRALRAAVVRILPPAARRRFSVSQFDRVVATRIARHRGEAINILHVWNDLPRTIAAARKRNPGCRVIRDVAIAREYDFETGASIQAEDARVDLFLSPSAYVTESLQTSGVAAQKIREIPFGVDTTVFRPVVEKPETPLRFAFVGAVSERKGVPGLLRVLRKLNLPDAELHLYGTVKPEVAPLLHDIPRVYAYGRTTVADKLPRNHVFVFPSTREGSAKAVYEALACGLPVITTPNAGSVARDEVDGLIVPPEDDDALAAALRRIYEDGSLRRRMALNARRRAEEYPWERYARAVWQTYAEVAGKTRTRPK